ncbi:MAG TPA: ATP-binding protein [Candidatus Binatia bacterium]|nr:ATP-binding protein [Candidatus Binatia bacterium]
MKFRWSSLGNLRELLRETSPAPEEMALRLKTVERDIILPVKAVGLAILMYSLYRSRWFEDMTLTSSIVHAMFERFFIIYLCFNVAMAVLLIISRDFPSLWLQRLIFASSCIDGLFLAALTFRTGGFDSSVYWLFLGLIVRNAISLPFARTQLVLNFLLSGCYFLAGLLDVTLAQLPEEQGGPNPAEPFALRVFVLWLLTICCFGVQVLLQKQRLAHDEGREFSARQNQLQSAGRLAAQIAHQLKNPLGIINNAAFSLQKTFRDAQDGPRQQIGIIREEVQRADKIITQLMGYSQLAEGKVERLSLSEAIDRAIHEVFPRGAAYETVLIKDLSEPLPTLMMQRGHLNEILVNLLTNGREALQGKGTITITAHSSPDDVVTLTVADNGPGIAPELLDKIFEAYFTTKDKGTGLGLAITKHNVELYGGSVKVESKLGKGTRFVLNLPTRTFMKLQS